ncbi:DUF6089 family protein [Flavihumibacter stibioxidans]|uniref:DUF6089 domain-containing protein n=1 Tax=Flavihumibacter stibioxidans TaxID=1834163 RepID=A0ABR7M4D4_9BACT|nr:DUF6089 family protein [Flavihumibacter stibioxidans]MBC6489516.1 hypothetical protein [Flavihumibacter stibioxidans]
MRKFLLVLVAVFPLSLMAQRWHITGFGGISNYQGDMQEKRITTNQAHGAFGLGAQYDLSGHVSVKGGLMYGTISGDDKFNKQEDLRKRNLNFTSRLLEGNLMAEFRLFDLDEKRLTPYVFAGIAVFGYDPYTYDTLGNKHYLQPYGTEGQGLSTYPDRKPYNRVQVALPFGGGIKFRLNDQVTLGYEIGLRKTFTDYLDDLSKSYVDYNTLLAEKGPVAVELAYRGDELKDGNPLYPADGTTRGGEKVKDWYYFQGITIGYRLFGGRNEFRGGAKGSGRQLDCPRNIF